MMSISKLVVSVAALKCDGWVVWPVKLPVIAIVLVL